MTQGVKGSRYVPRGAVLGPQTEQQLHAAVADLLDAVLPDCVVWTTFPAGWGKLGRATAGKLKRAGLKEGIPDILLFWSGKTLGIELKVGRNKQTPAQINMEQRLNAAGVYTRLCRSVEDVVFVLEGLNVPMRSFILGGVDYGTAPRHSRRVADSQAGAG